MNDYLGSAVNFCLVLPLGIFKLGNMPGLEDLFITKMRHPVIWLRLWPPILSMLS